MAAWDGNTSRISDLLWGESGGGSPHKWSIIRSFGVSSVAKLKNLLSLICEAVIREMLHLYLNFSVAMDFSGFQFGYTDGASVLVYDSRVEIGATKSQTSTNCQKPGRWVLSFNPWRHTNIPCKSNKISIAHELLFNCQTVLKFYTEHDSIIKYIYTTFRLLKDTDLLFGNLRTIDTQRPVMLLCCFLYMLS